MDSKILIRNKRPLNISCKTYSYFRYGKKEDFSSVLLDISHVGSVLIGWPLTNELRFVVLVDNLDGTLLGVVTNVPSVVHQHKHLPLTLLVPNVYLFERLSRVN